MNEDQIDSLNYLLDKQRNSTVVLFIGKDTKTLESAYNNLLTMTNHSFKHFTTSGLFNKDNQSKLLQETESYNNTIKQIEFISHIVHWKHFNLNECINRSNKEILQSINMNREYWFGRNPGLKSHIFIWLLEDEYKTFWKELPDFTDWITNHFRI